MLVLFGAGQDRENIGWGDGSVSDPGDALILGTLLANSPGHGFPVRDLEGCRKSLGQHHLGHSLYGS